MSYGAMLHQLATTDVHPPLHHTVLWLTVRAVRRRRARGAPAVAHRRDAAGPGALPRRPELYDRRAGLAAAALGAVAPFPVWYSQEARMYAFFMLFATLALWMQVRALRRGSRADWVALRARDGGADLHQYFGVLLVLTQQAVFAIAFLRGDRRRCAPGWARRG